MGVDYTAQFGIGAKVKIKKFDNTNIVEILEELLKNEEDFYYFEYGSRCYGGDAYYCIIINEPFKDGIIQLEQKMIRLKQFLENNNIEIDGDIGLVGGLHIW